jgi:hypothetical protein
MSLTRLCTLALAGTLAAAGCGGEDNSGPPAKMGMTNPTAAKAVVGDATMLKATAKQQNAGSLQLQVQALAMTGAQQLVSPSFGQPLTAALVRAQTAGSTTCPQGGTATCSDAVCVYKMCKEDNLTMDGTIKVADAGDTTTITNDWTISGKPDDHLGGQAGTIDNMVWKISGVLSISPTSLNGSLQSSGTAMISNVPGLGGGGYTYTDFSLLKYNTVGLNGVTPISGSVYGKWSVGVSGLPGGAGLQSYEGTVNFP